MILIHLFISKPFCGSQAMFSEMDFARLPSQSCTLLIVMCNIVIMFGMKNLMPNLARAELEGKEIKLPLALKMLLPVASVPFTHVISRFIIVNDAFQVERNIY